MDNKVLQGTSDMKREYDFSIGSLNVRGINNVVKRNAIFKWLKAKKFDIVFLQECYCGESDESVWLDEWEGTGLFSHGSKHSRGTVVLFRRGFDVEVVDKQIDKNGRYILSNVKLQGELFLLANVYAPNRTEEKQFFFNEVQRVLEVLKIQDCNRVIIGGDWNSILNIELDKKGGNMNPHETVVNSLKELINSQELIDIWRLMNPTTKRFTYRQKTPLIQSRLDFFLINEDAQDIIFSTDIIPSVWSDHSCITVYINHLPDTVRGKGHWKLNSSVLGDDKYINEMKGNLTEWLEEYRDIQDKRVVWELVKYHIRKATMSFCSQRKMDKNNEEKRLEQELKKSEIDLAIEPNDHVLFEYNRIKERIKEIEQEKIQGAIIRSKSKFVEEGEKSTSYFFGLEKRNAVKKQMRKLKMKDGEIITDSNKILKEQTNFYKNLYSSKIPENDDIGKFTNDQLLPKLTTAQKQLCEADLSLDEIKSSLSTFSKNKSPGNDGITTEFYLKFWDNIGQAMLDNFIYSFEHGELSNSQKQAVIILLDKPGKERQLLNNWRPISLLNHDYKILTKALSLRIQKVLPFIIHRNQSGYVDGRFIGDSIRVIQDIMAYTQINNLPGLLLFIDFKKAFDSVEKEFMIETLKSFNFGQNIINWISLVYKNASSCILNNGVTSSYFKIGRGVRQGDPLSPYLFVLVIELLAHAIRNEKEIKGIKVGTSEIKITLYADDITLILSDLKSGKEALKLLDQYSKCSGLHINREKTEGMWIGRWKDNVEKPFNIKWPKEPIKALGIYHSYDRKAFIKANFEDKIAQLIRQLHWWKSRNLSLTGRVLIVKTLGLSKFSLLASMVEVPQHIIKQINALVYEFIWKGKTDKVNRVLFSLDYEYGGYRMIGFDTQIKAAKIKWIQRYLEQQEKDWNVTFEAFCKKKNLTAFLMSNFMLNELPENLPSYYQESIDAWFYVKENNKDYQSKAENQLIWYNKYCLVNHVTMYNENLFQSGIWMARDLFENGNIIPYATWQERGALQKNYMFWRQIISSIPVFMKQNILSTFNDNVEYPTVDTDNKQVKISKVSEKDLKNSLSHTKYKLLKENDFKAKRKFDSLFGEIDDKLWHNIYSLPRRIMKDNKIIELQYKILYRYIGTNRLLYKIGKKESPRCTLCALYDESIEHLFYECNKARNLWLSVLNIWNTLFETEIELSVKDIILGYKLTDALTDTEKALNVLILYGKQYIFDCKRSEKEVCIHSFKLFLKRNVKICKYPTQIHECLQDVSDA